MGALCDARVKVQQELKEQMIKHTDSLRQSENRVSKKELISMVRGTIPQKYCHNTAMAIPGKEPWRNPTSRLRTAELWWSREVEIGAGPGADPGRGVAPRALRSVTTIRIHRGTDNMTTTTGSPDPTTMMDMTTTPVSRRTILGRTTTSDRRVTATTGTTNTTVPDTMKEDTELWTLITSTQVSSLQISSNA